MHKTIILWISTLVITFLTGYIYNISDSSYPLTGTIGIEGQKISYMFDKIHYGDNDYRLIIRTDLKGLKGKVKWHEPDKTDYWYESDLIEKEKILISEIPLQPPFTKIEYKVILSYNEQEYMLPVISPASMIFYAKVPVPVKFFNGLLLYSIIFLSVRTMLDSFNAKHKIKKYSFITAVVVLLFTAMIHPLYLSYKYGYINRQVPPIENLFPVYAIILLILWIVFTALIFKAENPKPYAATAGLLTIFTYLLIRF